MNSPGVRFDGMREERACAEPQANGLHQTRVWEMHVRVRRAGHLPSRISRWLQPGGDRSRAMRTLVSQFEDQLLERTELLGHYDSGSTVTRSGAVGSIVCPGRSWIGFTSSTHSAVSSMPHSITAIASASTFHTSFRCFRSGHA